MEITVEIVPVGEVQDKLLVWLAAELPQLLPSFRCTIARRFAPRAEWADAATGMHDSDAILDALVDWHDSRERGGQLHWLLGVTGARLAASGRSFVFGEAVVGGCCAVIGLDHLRPGAAERGEGLALFRTRILKEALHELGHVGGLDHCANPGCVMFPSPDIQASDAKGSEFCSPCGRRFADCLGSPRAPGVGLDPRAAEG
jgi:archaemetzincin